MGAASGINIGSVGGDFSLQAGGDIVAGNKTVINNIIQRLAKELTTTPYKFLASYDVADRDIFYGRAAVVDELAGAVARHKAIVINGASGAGKSSLVNAGVIPRLADNGYSYVAFREYSDPLEQFTHLGNLLAASPLPRTEIGSDNAAALPRQAAARAVSSSESGETGATKAPDLNDPGLLLQLIRAVHATPIVVVFDQFERFFVNVLPEKRNAFISAFKHCLHHSTAQEINFVFALRHEFYGQLLLEFEAEIPEFSNEAYRLNLLPLTQSEAREAIVKPLENTSLRIQYDEDFVDHVLLAGLAAQTGGSTNVNPPHLQIVCNQLFEAARQRLQQRSSVLIDERLYNELGGVQTILNTYLDKMVEEVANDPQRITVVRSVLQRMIDTTGTRRFVTEELLKRELPDVNEAEILAFIQKLLDRRVVEQRKPSYSLSHEYLVKRVKDWFDPIEMERKRAQETLERGLAEWKNSQALLNQPQVEAVRKWVTSVNPEEQVLLQESEADYLKKEREEAEREKQLLASNHARRTAIRIGLAASILLTVVAAGFAVQSRRETKLALVSRSRALAALSQQEINTVLQDHTAMVGGAAFSPDGTRIVTASSEGAAQLWDAASGQNVAALQGHAKVTRVEFGANGLIMTTLSDGSVQVWLASGSRLNLGKIGYVTWATFSPDGTRIVATTKDKEAWLWDVASKQLLAVLLGHTAEVISAAFSPDSSRIVTTSRDQTARLWYAASGKLLAVLRGHSGSGVYSAAFSGDGGRIVTTSSDGTAQVWDAASGRNLAVLYAQPSVAVDKTDGHTARVDSAAFSGDGTRVMTSSLDKTARLWRTFPNTQTLIDYARATVPRQLTSEERQDFFLDPAPPYLASEKKQ